MTRHSPAEHELPVEPAADDVGLLQHQGELQGAPAGLSCGRGGTGVSADAPPGGTRSPQVASTKGHGRRGRRGVPVLRPPPSRVKRHLLPIRQGLSPPEAD